MFITREKYNNMQRCICWKSELAKNYQHKMIRSAMREGELEAEITLLREEIKQLKRERDEMKTGVAS